MKNSNIIFIALALIAAAAIYLTMDKRDSEMPTEELTNPATLEEMESEPDSRATDYNSSRSNRTTSASMNDVDQDCTGPDCEALDDDSDNDSVPNDDTAGAAEASGYVKLEGVKGESTR